MISPIVIPKSQVMDTRYARTWMWSQALRMLDEAQQLGQQFFRPPADQDAAGVWEPPVDVYETDAAWVVLVALPGVPMDRVRFRLDADSLDVTAVREIPSVCKEGAIRRKEIPHGRFHRRLYFREPPRGIVEARIEDGCLLLTLLKPRP